jgi:hypothetical protein
LVFGEKGREVRCWGRGRVCGGGEQGGVGGVHLFNDIHAGVEAGLDEVAVQGFWAKGLVVPWTWGLDISAVTRRHGAMDRNPERPDNPPYDLFQDDDDDLAISGGADPLDTGYSPPEEMPFAARQLLEGDDDEETTPLDSRLDLELPEVWDEDSEDWDAQRAGRLVLTSTEADRDVFAFDVGVDGGAASAEEAAIHIIDDSLTDED